MKNWICNDCGVEGVRGEFSHSDGCRRCPNCNSGDVGPKIDPKTLTPAELVMLFKRGAIMTGIQGTSGRAFTPHGEATRKWVSELESEVLRRLST